MRLIFFILVSSLLISKDPVGLDEFVENYFLLSKSKMENSPIAWQDTREGYYLSLIHISEPTRRRGISYAVFCLKKKIEESK